MNTLPITPTDITQDPMLVSVGVELRTGESVVLRPLAPSDANVLGVYFLSLSNETKRRYGPHPFDQATADRLCAENDYAHTIRMLTTKGDDDDERVIAYFILVLGVGEDDALRYAKLGMILNAATDCTLAPSVADTYQDKGLGSVMMRHVIEVARRLGKQRMVLMGGVQATNSRAKHFYEKHGFQHVGDFEEPAGRNNHDMILDL
jgi:diamine N-acetyltransferase